LFDSRLESTRMSTDSSSVQSRALGRAALCREIAKAELYWVH
jgi:hypothetical protein